MYLTKHSPKLFAYCSASSQHEASLSKSINNNLPIQSSNRKTVHKIMASQITG